MRFGVMSLQKGLLIPSAAAPADALAAVSGMDHAALARRLFEAGFNPIELSGDMGLFFPHSLAPAAVEGLAALKEETGLSYTVHLPLWSVEPSTLLGPVRQGSVRALVDCVRATQPLEPEVYVLHATGALAAEFYRMGLPALAEGLILRQFQAAAGESIRALLAETGLEGRRLAVETIEFPLDLTLELVQQHDLSICLDTGHIMAGFSGNADLFEVLELVLPRLAEVHLHDAAQWRPGQPPGYGTDHRPLGTGELDHARFLARLAQAGFDGPIILELTVEEALASLAAIKGT